MSGRHTFFALYNPSLYINRSQSHNSINCEIKYRNGCVRKWTYQIQAAALQGFDVVAFGVCEGLNKQSEGFDIVALGVCEGQKTKFWLMRQCERIFQCAKDLV